MSVLNINKDNFESVKLVITNGNDYEKEYNLGYSFEESYLQFTSNEEINNGVVIDELTDSEYYILLRLKLNNSIIQLLLYVCAWCLSMEICRLIT